MKKKLIILIPLIIILFTNQQYASEILLYADSIGYDSDKNIIAKGNAKIISEDQLIVSNLIIYDKKNEKYLLPGEFTFKDERENYYYGSSGEFTKDLKNAKISGIKLLKVLDSQKNQYCMKLKKI